MNFYADLKNNQKEESELFSSKLKTNIYNPAQILKEVKDAIIIKS